MFVEQYSSSKWPCQYHFAFFITFIYKHVRNKGNLLTIPSLAASKYRPLPPRYGEEPPPFCGLWFISSMISGIYIYFFIARTELLSICDAYFHFHRWLFHYWLVIDLSMAAFKHMIMEADIQRIFLLFRVDAVGEHVYTLVLLLQIDTSMGTFWILTSDQCLSHLWVTS